MNPLRRELERLSRDWIAHGMPSREKVIAAAASLSALKKRYAPAGLWPAPPRMVTATLDDGFGHGIEIIGLYAEVMGIEVIPLGLLQKPRVIAAACHAQRPDYLGLTVLQLDSEDDLALVSSSLPAGTRLIAGGPAFRLDPDLSSRCGVHATAAHAGHFIKLILHGGD
jgi:hypothetical protein